jgi:hypothetical protein
MASRMRREMAGGRVPSCAAIAQMLARLGETEREPTDAI